MIHPILVSNCMQIRMYDYGLTKQSLTFSPTDFSGLKSQLRNLTRRRNLIIQQTGQEIGIIFACNLAGKIATSKLELIALGPLGGQLVDLLL